MYTFTEDCRLGIEEIDKEHEELFRLINEAQELLDQKMASEKIVANIVDHLGRYAREHFAHEEAYMESIKDPELPRQKKEHQAFAAKIENIDLSGAGEEESRDILANLVQYLAKWLYHHILGSDIMIGTMTEAEKESPFAFTSEYKTDIPLVDEEHARLFRIIEEAYDLMKEELLSDKYDQIMEILEELKEYTKTHFRDEEAYMEKIGYEGLKAQKMAHESFVDKLNDMNLQEIDDSQQESLYELIDYLLAWLKNHILKMDKKIPVVRG